VLLYQTVLCFWRLFFYFYLFSKTTWCMQLSKENIWSHWLFGLQN